MPLNLKNSHFLQWVLFLFFNYFFLFFFLVVVADPRISVANLDCGNVRSVPQEVIPNFVEVMEDLSKLVVKQGWGTIDGGSVFPSLYSLSQCMNDLSHIDCLYCYAEARTRLPRCLPSLSARVHLDGRFLRWDTYSFFQEAVNDKGDKRVCNTSSVALIEDNLKLEFIAKAKEVIENVTRIASKDGFAVGETKSRGVVNVYALAQCWKTVNTTGCKMCLEKAVKEVNQCLPGREGRALNTGCYLRYSTERFYNVGKFKNDDKGKDEKRIRTVIFILIPTIIFVIFVIACICFFVRKQKPLDEFETVNEFSTVESLQYDFDTVRTATNDFSATKKLGQGGFGVVYKGRIQNGREVAVKRLSKSSNQGEQEFKNEVLLMANLQHRNLVRLIGFCLKGTERLLIYEFIPNASLDQFIFDPEKRGHLDGYMRYNIIGGIARGLLYLHEDSRVRIIPRNLKASNVLLDATMNPKIADFGMAKILDLDENETQASTQRIVGTYGYMAPEYARFGQF